MRRSSDGEILAVHVLHREERQAVDLADVVHAADVLVRDLAREPHLGVELREPHRVGLERRRQELQRDRLPELEVVGAVDLAHPALALAIDDAVAAVEEGAGLEAAVAAVGRRPATRPGWTADATSRTAAA